MGKKKTSTSGCLKDTPVEKKKARKEDPRNPLSLNTFKEEAIMKKKKINIKFQVDWEVEYIDDYVFDGIKLNHLRCKICGVQEPMKEMFKEANETNSFYELPWVTDESPSGDKFVGICTFCISTLDYKVDRAKRKAIGEIEEVFEEVKVEFPCHDCGEEMYSETRQLCGKTRCLNKH